MTDGTGDKNSYTHARADAVVGLFSGLEWFLKNRWRSFFFSFFFLLYVSSLLGSSEWVPFVSGDNAIYLLTLHIISRPLPSPEETLNALDPHATLVMCARVCVRVSRRRRWRWRW